MSDSPVSAIEARLAQLPRFSVSGDRKGLMLETSWGEFVAFEHVSDLLRELLDLAEGVAGLSKLVSDYEAEEALIQRAREFGELATAALRRPVLAKGDMSKIDAQLEAIAQVMSDFGISDTDDVPLADVLRGWLSVHSLELSRLTADHAQQGKEEDRLALRAHLDGVTVTSENIGDIRRSLFMPFDSAWNGLVRDETAKREGRTLDGDRDSSMAGRHVEAMSLLTNVSGSEPDDSHQRIAELEAHLAQQGKDVAGRELAPKWIPEPGDYFTMRGLLATNWRMHSVDIFRCVKVETDGLVRVESAIGTGYHPDGWVFTPLEPYKLAHLAQQGKALEAAIPELSDDDASRLSRIFNGYDVIEVDQYHRINEFLKAVIARSRGTLSPRPSNSAPDDWAEFVIAAFNEGWAASASGEFTSLQNAYDWSHVKLELATLSTASPQQERP